MNIWLMRIATVLVALELLADLVGLIVLPLPLNPEVKRVTLLVIFGITLLWNLAMEGVLLVANPMGPAPAGGGAGAPLWSERRRRVGLYFSTVSTVLTFVGIVLLVTGALPFAVTVWILATLLVIDLAVDGTMSMVVVNHP